MFTQIKNFLSAQFDKLKNLDFQNLGAKSVTSKSVNTLLNICAVCIGVIVLLIFAALLFGCGKQTSEDKIKAQVEDKVHALSAEERLLAETNAKQFFNREFPQLDASTGKMGAARGMFLDCRPSDSNYNGLVTCHGVVPKVNGGFDDKSVRYCGYMPKLVGCSDEDTVK